MAYQGENDETTSSSIVGTEFTTVMNIRGLVRNLTVAAKKFHPKEEFTEVLFDELQEVIDEGYSEEEVMQ